jgi:hypothetical protein
MGDFQDSFSENLAVLIQYVETLVLSACPLSYFTIVICELSLEVFGSKISIIHFFHFLKKHHLKGK